MENLKTFSVFIIISAFFSFGIWTCWMFSNYEITTTEIFIRVLASAFSTPPLFHSAIKSILLGTLLGCGGVYLYTKIPSLKFKPKGFIRRADSPTNLSKITRPAEEENQIAIAGVPIPPDLECLHFLIGGSTGFSIPKGPRFPITGNILWNQKTAKWIEVPHEIF